MPTRKPRPNSIDPQQFQKLWEAAVPNVRGYLLALCREDDTAREILSQTYVKAFGHRHRFDQQKGSFRQWIFTIAYNEFVSDWRSSWQQRVDLIEDIDMISDPRGESIEDKLDNRNKLRKAETAVREEIDQHQGTRQYVLKEVFLEKKGYEEIANDTGWEKPRIRKVVSRARVAIKSRLKKSKKASGGSE